MTAIERLTAALDAVPEGELPVHRYVHRDDLAAVLDVVEALHELSRVATWSALGRPETAPMLAALERVELDTDWHHVIESGGKRYVDGVES